MVSATASSPKLQRQKNRLLHKMKMKELANCGIKVLEFKVLGNPVAQARPRFAQMGNHVRVYDSKASAEEKAAVRLIAQQAIKQQQWAFPSPEMPIRVEIVSCRKIPKGKQRWFSEAARLNLVAPLNKPDNDNILKLYMDAMNGVVYPDDKQVFDARVRKVFGEQAYTYVKVIGYFQSYGDLKATCNASLKNNAKKGVGENGTKGSE